MVDVYLLVSVLWPFLAGSTNSRGLLDSTVV
jgi:hypothetical protein